MYSYPPSNIVSRQGSPGDVRGSREGSLGSLTGGSNSPGGRSFSTIFMQPWTKADQRRREVEALNNLQTVQARRKGWMDVLSNQPRDFRPPVPSFGPSVQGRQQEIIAQAYPINGSSYLNPNQHLVGQPSVDWRNFVQDPASAQPVHTPKSPYQFALEKRISGLQSMTPGNSPTAAHRMPMSPLGSNPNTDKNLMRQLVDLENTLKAEREARVANEEALSMRCSLLSDELSNLQRRYTDLQVGGSNLQSPASRLSAFQGQVESNKSSPSSRARRSLVPMITEDSHTLSSADFIQSDDVKVSATLVPTWTIAASEKKSFSFLHSHPKPSPLSPHRLEERLFSDSASATVGYPESVPATPKDMANLKEAPPGPMTQITPPRVSPQFAAQQAPVHRTAGAIDGGWRSAAPLGSRDALAAHLRPGAPMAGGQLRASTGALDGGWGAAVSGSLDAGPGLAMRSSTGMLAEGAAAWRHPSGSVSQPGNISNVGVVHRSRFSGMERPPRQQLQPPPPGRFATPPSHAYSAHHGHAAVVRAQPQEPPGGGSSGMYAHNLTTMLNSSAPMAHRDAPQRAPQPVQQPSAQSALYARPTAQERAMPNRVIPMALPSRVRNQNELLGGYPTPLKRAIALTDALKRPDPPRPSDASFAAASWRAGDLRARNEEALRLGGELAQGQGLQGGGGAVVPGSVGLVLSQAGFGSGVLVQQVLPGLPAKLDGTIRAGDMLTLVEDWNVAGRGLIEVQRLLDGAEGSVVLLSLVRFSPTLAGMQPRPYSVRLRRSAKPVVVSTAAAFRGLA